MKSSSSAPLSRSASSSPRHTLSPLSFITLISFDYVPSPLYLFKFLAHATIPLVSVGHADVAASLVIFPVPSPADHLTHPIRKELASDFRVPSSGLLSQSLEAPKPQCFPFPSSHPPESFHHGLVPLQASQHLPNVAAATSVVVMTPPVVERMGFVSPSFPESAEFPFRPRQTGRGPNIVLRPSQVSPHLPAPLLLASSVLSSHLRSLTRCSVARPFSPHVRHTTPHDVVLPMSHEPSSSTELLRVKLHSSSARLPTRGSD